MPGTVNAMCEHGAIAVSLFISFRILVQEKSFFFERHRWIKLHAVCTVDTFSLTFFFVLLVMVDQIRSLTQFLQCAYQLASFTNYQRKARTQAQVYVGARGSLHAQTRSS